MSATLVEGDWRVRILDLSGDIDDNVVEDVTGFLSLEHANLFAQRYVRDSVERCRAQGMAPEAVLDAWRAYGEDAHAVAGENGATGNGATGNGAAGNGAGPDVWTSVADVHGFAEVRPEMEDRDWRSIDPRIPHDDDEDE